MCISELKTTLCNTWTLLNCFKLLGVQNPGNKGMRRALYSQDGLSNHHKTGRVVKLSDPEWEKLTLLLKAGNSSLVNTNWKGWWIQERSYFPIQKYLTPDKEFVPSPNILLHYYIELLSEWFRGWRTMNPQPWEQRVSQQPSIQDKKRFLNASCF